MSVLRSVYSHHNSCHDPRASQHNRWLCSPVPAAACGCAAAARHPATALRRDAQATLGARQRARTHAHLPGCRRRHCWPLPRAGPTAEPCASHPSQPPAGVSIKKKKKKRLGAGRQARKADKVHGAWPHSGLTPASACHERQRMQGRCTRRDRDVGARTHREALLVGTVRGMRSQLATEASIGFISGGGERCGARSRTPAAHGSGTAAACLSRICSSGAASCGTDTKQGPQGTTRVLEQVTGHGCVCVCLPAGLHSRSAWPHQHISTSQGEA